jgi:hypothetical protein
MQSFAKLWEHKVMEVLTFLLLRGAAGISLAKTQSAAILHFHFLIFLSYLCSC